MKLAATVTTALALALLVACGPSERPKLDVKREPRFAPLKVPEAKEIYKEPAATTATDAVVVEVGAFKGACDYSFSGINASDVVALASSTGLRSYRLAGIAIPDSMRDEAHSHLRGLLGGEKLGIEMETGDPGGEPSVYVYRCTAKTMLNADLVSAGLAMVSDAPTIHRDALNKASMQALSARRGVWGKPKE